MNSHLGKFLQSRNHDTFFRILYYQLVLLPYVNCLGRGTGRAEF